MGAEAARDSGVIEVRASQHEPSPSLQDIEELLKEVFQYNVLERNKLKKWLAGLRAVAESLGTACRAGERARERTTVPALPPRALGCLTYTEGRAVGHGPSLLTPHGPCPALPSWPSGTGVSSTCSAVAHPSGPAQQSKTSTSKQPDQTAIEQALAPPSEFICRSHGTSAIARAAVTVRWLCSPTAPPLGSPFAARNGRRQCPGRQDGRRERHKGLCAMCEACVEDCRQ